MTFDELHTKIEQGDYEPKLPYPPYRKDKEQRTRHEAEDRAMKQAYREDWSRLRILFEADLKAYMTEQLGFPVTDEQFQPLYKMAWDEGHSDGYMEILNYADDYIRMVKPFLQQLTEAKTLLTDIWGGLVFHHLAEPGKVFATFSDRVEKVLAKEGK